MQFNPKSQIARKILTFYVDFMHGTKPIEKYL